MNRFLKRWRLTGRGKAFRARVVAYADDFVILSRGCAAEALAWTNAVMTRIGLTLNEAKTSLKNARRERFDFLGYSFGPYYYKGNGRLYLSASVSKKSMQRLKAKVANLCPAISIPGWTYAMHSTRSSLVGRATSPMGRIGRPFGVSTIMSMSAYAISSRDGTRPKGVGRISFLTT